MHSEFLLALRQIEREREIPPEEIQEIVEDALAKAFQQEADGLQSVRVEFDMNTGRLWIFQVREAVEEVMNTSLQISMEECKRISEDIELGDLVETPVSLRNFRRIGIQAVKHHIVQRVRDMERSINLERFLGREGQLITGTVNRITANGVLVNLDRIDGILPNSERIPGEKYMIGRKIKVVILEVRTGGKDSDIILSRSHPEFVKRLFDLEVPEISQNIVQVREIVREAGYRTKMAVYSTQDKVDPVGACVGYKGSRVKNIVNELNGEKIDIIPWSDEPAQFIAYALSPAQVVSVEIFDDQSAEVIVPDGQLSLAIGKQGQNARLANKLTGWKIDILSETEKERLMQEMQTEDMLSRRIETTKLAARIIKVLTENGFNIVYDLVCLTEDELSAIPGMGEKSVQDIKLFMAENGLELRREGAEKPAPPPSDGQDDEESGDDEQGDEGEGQESETEEQGDGEEANETEEQSEGDSDEENTEDAE